MSLRLVDLRLGLHGRPLLAPVDAEVGAGEVLVLMGPSGCGKSSLLAWIAGLLQPPLDVRGRVELDGDDLTQRPTEARRIGLLFQDDLLFPNLSVLQNLLFALPAGPRAAREQAARQALAQAGLAGLEGRAPASLSGGQRARVSLLRSLLAAPRALLLDEPFSRLDVPLRAQMREFTWAALRERRVPALLVTHDPQDVPAGARVIELRPPVEPGDA